MLELLKNGEPNKVIARRLGTTEGTVKLHVRQIMRKLGATNRTQAAVTAQLYDKAADKIYEIESDASSHSELSE